MGRLEELSGLFSGAAGSQNELVDHDLLPQRIHVVFVFVVVVVLPLSLGADEPLFVTSSSFLTIDNQVELASDT